MTKVDHAEFPLFGAVTPDLEGILEHWTERGTTCKKHGGTIHGDRCSPVPCGHGSWTGTAAGCAVRSGHGAKSPSTTFFGITSGQPNGVTVGHREGRKPGLNSFEAVSLAIRAGQLDPWTAEFLHYPHHQGDGRDAGPGIDDPRELEQRIPRPVLVTESSVLLDVFGSTRMPRFYRVLARAFDRIPGPAASVGSRTISVWGCHAAERSA